MDGWFIPGLFRNYGQLLILNAGGGYHVLLAGMERISVDLGQFVRDGRARCGDGWRQRSRPRPWRSAAASRCCTSNSARTGHPSIQAHGGPQVKAKRFADDAQDFPHSPRRSGGRSPDADLHPTPHRVRRGERTGGRGRHLSAAQPVRRRVRAGARRLCGKARRRQAGRVGHQRHARRRSIRTRATWIPRASATCRCRPAASSAASASRSPWRTA